MPLFLLCFLSLMLPHYALEVHRVKGLEATTPSILAQYGSSAVMNSSLIAVAAPRDSISESFAGAIYVYARETKEHLITLTPPTGNAMTQVGTTLAISDEFLVAGSPRYNNNQGVVYVWDTTSGDLLYTLTHPMPQNDDQFGSALSVMGGTLLVGAKGDENEGTGEAERNHGSALEFNLSNAGAYVRTYTAPTLISEDLFGQAVHVSDSFLIIGCSNRSYNGVVNSGVAYVYHKSTGMLARTLVASDPKEAGFFGFSLDSFEDKLCVGTGIADEEQGAIYVFDLTTGTQSLQILEPESGSSGFGRTLAMTDYIFAGSFLDGTGSVSVYDNSGTLLHSFSEGGASGAQFSRALDAHKGGILIGAPNVKTNNLSSSGAAYVYAANDLQVSLSTEGEDIVLNWQTKATRSYSVSYSADLINWTPISESPFTAVSSSQSTTHSGGNSSEQLFYKVTEL